MKTEVRTITPEIAKEMLKRNTSNRNLNEKHCNYLSQQMINDKWMFDGQPIRFSESGGLLDGQHRLNAVIKSNKEIPFLILTGIDSNAFKVMDTDRNRNAADCFSIKGIEYYADVAACARMILNFKKNRLSESGENKISNTDLIEWYEENKIINEYIKRADSLNVNFSRVLSRAYIASLTYLFSEKDVLSAEIFMSKLCTGLDLGISSPIYILRKRLIDDKMSKAKLPAREKLALIIKAWNFYRIGKEVKVLKWQNTDEEFPIVK